MNMTSHVISPVTDASFEQDVLQSDVPVLVDFWAEWCRPCQMIAPILEELAQAYAGKARIVKLNVEENPLTAAKLGVRGIPTLMLYKDGRMIGTRSGYMNKSQLTDFLDLHL